ncbi:MAG: CopY family transcriptional regulator [bacterium (Candidatus Ratteibacteria) CG23_combo_of_CG06-09_8_20_14_all_48_7]|uniref:CopY family transcriptional regulator n=1 Tax=bacterium (Candidatus Ratteibacteria) CG23_combo_of_CG06-09_8_20_14_all_48_7 TaxID=2014292 RepID=A0A2G9YAR1_9BACT|nr:MAG: CopY family transcriptional regulator [bacterium (Candidatus Ratteibacteria) CG23_combo_of_CG06-09_8_20_14_all_48_7]
MICSRLSFSQQKEKTMAKTKGLSAAELEVMKVLWEKKATTVKEVQQELSHKKAWRYTTVLTFIVRLYNKGYLKRKKEGMVYIYSPTLPEKKTKGKMVEDFVDRVFDGNPTPLMNYLSESNKLKPSEVTALKNLVAILNKEAKNGRDTEPLGR